MKMKRFGPVAAFGLALMIATPAAAQPAMPKTTTEKIHGKPVVKTEKLTGTVLGVDGNQLMVRLADGELRVFNVPASRTFNVDGRELSVRDLQPDTTLAATVTTTYTPVTTRTITIGSGRVWHVSGKTVILTLPNNENRVFNVEDSYKFIVNGQPATVHDLSKGMFVSATKIVEEPITEITKDTVVTGHAPQAQPSEAKR